MPMHMPTQAAMINLSVTSNSNLLGKKRSAAVRKRRQTAIIAGFTVSGSEKLHMCNLCLEVLTREQRKVLDFITNPDLLLPKGCTKLKPMASCKSSGSSHAARFIAAL
jgi:hypothetical protein